MACDGKRKGFTLLEMLVAMTLMSILAASLYASLHAAFKARDSALAAVGPAREAGLAMDLVCRDIESALPPTGILAGEFAGTDSQDATGHDADTLLFYAALTDGEGERVGTDSRYGASGDAGTLLMHSAFANGEQVQVGCDVKRTEFTCSSDGLVRVVTANLLSPEQVEPPGEIICRNVSGINFRYFDGSDWFDEWDSSAKDNALPLAVEVTLTVRRPGPTQAGAEDYRLCRLLVLSCGSVAASGSARVIRNPG
jgi:prepilin-type N-terminal cleavage/methylation domain-containing protein